MSYSKTSNDSNCNSTYSEKSTSLKTFGEGIEYVLKKISYPSMQREIMTRHAQIIQNKIIKAIAKNDFNFKRAFKGLKLVGSFLDDVRIHLPDEYDLNVVLSLPLELKPVCVAGVPSFVFLQVISGDYSHRCVKRYGEKYFVNSFKLQQWLRDILSVAMPQIKHVKISRKRTYNLEYIARGTSVAHTFKATERSQNGRVIDFDFVPSFQFEAHQWPNGINKVPNQNLDWFAVPRKCNNPNVRNDGRFFIIAAPYWECLAFKKKQNLKDSWRLMKDFRDAKKMCNLSSFLIKNIFLNVCNKQKKTIRWSQSPGQLLIRMLVILFQCLVKNKLPLFLVPSVNCMEKLKDGTRRKYICIIRRGLRTLIRRRNANYLNNGDIMDLFGV